MNITKCIVHDVIAGRIVVITVTRPIPGGKRFFQSLQNVLQNKTWTDNWTSKVQEIVITSK